MRPAILIAGLGVVIAALLIFSVVSYSDQNSRTDMLAQQNRDLVQHICQTFNDSRIKSNTTIRRPLKQSLLQWVNLANSSLKNNNLTAKQRSFTINFRNKFQQYAHDVVIVGPVSCSLKGEK